MGTGIGQLLNQGKTALATAQTGMATTSHNVSNVNTEGYSRQRIEQATTEPDNYGKGRLGTGVTVRAITRTHNDFVSRRLEEEGSSLGKFEGLADIYQQLETVFKDDSEKGLSHSVSKFFNDIRTLSSQPESVPLRSAVRESAEGITTQFRAVAGNITSVVQDLDRRVEAGVSNVNQLTQRIAQLNQQIVNAEVNGGSANDERDSRDLAVQQLAKNLGIQITETETGAINISAGRIGVIVSGNEAFGLGAQRSTDGPNPGTMRVILPTSPNGVKGKDVSESIEGGALGGFLKVRDHDIPTLQEKVDTLAFGLAESVNGVHRESFGRNGAQGADFFADLGSVKNAASRLNLSTAVRSDVANIAAASRPNAAGDNRGLLRIADLQDARILEGGKANFTDYSSSIIGGLGVDAKAANESLDTQQGVMQQLGVLREQASGVSLDEEAMNMLKYQKAFDASAKLIQTADSMLETVLNLKRF